MAAATFTGTGITFPGSTNFPSSYLNNVGRRPIRRRAPRAVVPSSSVDNWNMGFGDMTFKYIPDPHPLPNTLGSGKVIVVTRGLLNASGL